jgi:hypothetical protein
LKRLFRTESLVGKDLPPPDCHSRIIPITIEVDADTDYKPNAFVNCGPLIPDDATAATTL